MKRALAAAGVVLLANAYVLASVARERSGPVTETRLTVCGSHVVGGIGSNAAPAIRLALHRYDATIPAGLDSAGLRALGFTAAIAGASGKLRDSAFLWPRQRPAWVRLTERGDSLHNLAVTGVAPRREELTPDSASLVVRGFVGFREQAEEAPHDSMAHQHGAALPAAKPGVLYPTVFRIMPAELHLARAQLTALRAALPADSGCAMTRQVRVAMGQNGSVWVDDAP